MISAHQQGGKIVIEIADDGRGLDVDKIREKAGISSEVTDEEAIQHIFSPGFSTKEGVTDLSGRGVGMDVVATRIRQLPDVERRVITMYYREGLLLREIGAVLKVTESRVSQIHSRALTRLHEILRDVKPGG